MLLLIIYVIFLSYILHEIWLCHRDGEGGIVVEKKWPSESPCFTFRLFASLKNVIKACRLLTRIVWVLLLAFVIYFWLHRMWNIWGSWLKGNNRYSLFYKKRNKNVVCRVQLCYHKTGEGRVVLELTGKKWVTDPLTLERCCSDTRSQPARLAHCAL